MARFRVGLAVSDNIQPDGSWRDPTAQMAMDIGLGKVNPNSAGYAAVEQAHQTYGSAHINGLWGHHGNAPAPLGSGWHFDSSGSSVSRPVPMPPSGAPMPASGGFDARYQREGRSSHPPMSAAAVRELLGLPPLTAEEESALAERRRAAAEAAAQQDAPRDGDDWGLFRDVCLGAAVGIVGALVVEFLRR